MKYKTRESRTRVLRSLAPSLGKLRETCSDTYLGEGFRYKIIDINNGAVVREILLEGQQLIQHAFEQIQKGILSDDKIHIDRC